MLGTRVMNDDPRLRAVAVGAAVGLGGGLLALLVVLAGPVMAFGAVIGLAVGLYVLVDLQGALIVMLLTVALLPFGTLPFQIAVTPTLLDCALGGFLAVYMMQWMTGQRRLFRFTPVVPVVVGFAGLMFFAFMLGLRYAPMTSRVIRNVAEMMMSLLLIPVLADVMRDTQTLRRAVLAVMLSGTLAALVGIGLWLTPDASANAALNTLSRIGYPVGSVLRYRQVYGAILNERAIGTWVDPNAFGGYLLMVGAVSAPQVFAPQPVVRRWLAAVMVLLILVALFLTDSRGAMLSLGAAMGLVAVLRYRKLLVIMGLAAVIALFLPFTQRYIAKLEAGLTNQDVETQMRFGEYKDALNLIEQYPVMGVGFSGTPAKDLYLGVANTYLTIASSAGLVGLAAYLLMMGSAYAYSAAHYARLRQNPALYDVWLGLAASIAGALVAGIFDHFYFKIEEFHVVMTAEYVILGLMVAAVRLAAESGGAAARRGMNPRKANGEMETNP